ncbi:replication factor-A carboxy-terminal domain protein [Trifolium medium]|uniref:Replication factor-A carboxy-terminal domain protein n=1 Tax=Trifolium medium TaxID=97028 RepID=A0A392M0I3_9FABA|nr:replication factor-A carboxy-terminal domain protein [Trifolium medium]
MIYTVPSSKLMLNPNFEVADALITRVVDNENYIIPEVKILSHSDILAHEDHVFSIAPKATIAGLAVTDVPATYIVLGTIKEVVAGNGWWYGSCRCMKKVIPSNGVYFCQACGTHILQGIPRYRFDLKVDDEQNSANFNVFDKAARDFLKISCSDMLLSQGSESIGADDVIPTAISGIVNKSYLFMVDVKPNNIHENVNNYIVKRMIDDPVLIGKFVASETDD